MENQLINSKAVEITPVMHSCMCSYDECLQTAEQPVMQARFSNLYILVV